MTKSTRTIWTGPRRKMTTPASWENRMAFTIPELAELSTIGRSTIYGAIERGELRMKKFGSRSVILAQDAKAWLEGFADRAPDADNKAA